MIGNLIGILILIFLFVGFGLLTWRSWHSRRAVLKWGGSILSVLLTILLAAVTVFAATGFYKIYTPQHPPVPNLVINGTPDQIARGEHIANVLCSQCHSTTGDTVLSGGGNFGEKSPIPIGMLVPHNLTPAGSLKSWSDGEIFNALREGVDKNGRTLIAMGGLPIRNLSDADIQAVIAYLRSQPATPSQVQLKEGDSPNFLFVVLAGAGFAPFTPPVSGQIVAPPEGPTVEYGKYIVSFQGCRDCHGPDLTGGKGGLTPVGPSLRVVKGWTQAGFMDTIRTGIDPTGHQLSDVMPWKDFRKMSDVELAAIYEYLHSLPAASQ